MRDALFAASVAARRCRDFSKPSEFEEFVKQFDDKKTYILKPRDGSEGNGIMLVQKVDQVSNSRATIRFFYSAAFCQVRRLQEWQRDKGKSLIAQEYIDK